MDFQDDGLVYGELRNFQVLQKYIGDITAPLHEMDRSKKPHVQYMDMVISAWMWIFHFFQKFKPTETYPESTTS